MFHMFQWLSQQSEWVLLIARLSLAAVMLVIGLPKVKPANFKANVKEFRDTFGLRPAPLWSTVNVVAEVVGGTMLVLGFWAEVAALVLAVQLVMGIIVKKLKLGANFRSGWSYDLLALALALIVAVSGPGALATWPLN